MAKQRYDIGIDSLSYAKSETPYVARPTKEILGFLDKREEQYIKTKNNINLATQLKNSLPYHDVSKGVYDNIVKTVDEKLSGITPENYADSELDTAQLVFDINNTMGGKELTEQQAKLTASVAAVDAFEGRREEKKNWDKQRIAESIKPITQDENGRFRVPSLATPTMVKDKTPFEDLDKLFKGWEADSMYSRNPDGTLTVDGSLIGKFGINKNTFASKQELFSTAMTYLATEPSMAEFINDEADFNLRNLNLTPANTLANIPTKSREILFPNKKPEDVTAQDVLAFSGGNKEILKELAKTGVKKDFMQNVAEAIATKYKFSRDDMTLVEDLDYAESIKARYSTKDTTVFNPLEGESLDQNVTVLPSITVTVGNPTAFSTFEAEETANVAKYVKVQENYKVFQAQFDNATPEQQDHMRERVNEAREAMEIADYNIQNSRQAQKNLTENTIALAKEKGVDVGKYLDYNTKVETLKEIKAENNKTIKASAFNVDVSNLVLKETNNINAVNLPTIDYVKPGNKTQHGFEANRSGTGIAAKKTVTLDIPGYDKTPLPVMTPAEYKASGTAQAVVIKDAKGKYSLAKKKSEVLGVVNSDDYIARLINKVGYASFNMVDKSGNSVPLDERTMKTVTTEKEFNTAVSKLVMNPNHKITDLPTAALKRAKEAAAEVSKHIKPSDVKVNQTLNYLYVGDNAKKGTAAYILKDSMNTIKETIESQGMQYKGKDDNGNWVDLPALLKSKGIMYTKDHIDFDKFDPSVMLTADREFGQLLNFPIPLTAEGRKAALKKDDKVFDMSGTLNIVAVNYSGKNSAANIKLRDANYLAYKESFGNTMASGDEVRKGYGLIEFNNSEASKSFYDLNLYTLGDGGKAKYTTPTGDKLVINAIKRSASPDKLGDNDFYLTNENADVFVIDKATNQPKFVSASEYSADKTSSLYKRQMFDSPEDVASLIGQTFLHTRATSANAAAIQRNQVRTTGTSYNVQPNNIKSISHNSNVTATIRNYGKTTTAIDIKDSKGAKITVQSRVPANELANIQEKYPKNVANDITPYLHTSVIPAVSKLIADYNLLITSAYRSDKKNAELEGAAKDSMHLYGKAIDARFNAKSEDFLKRLESNPQLATNLGISHAFKHVVDGKPHLHIDFK